MTSAGPAESFVVTRRLPDPRADDASRTVHVSAVAVTIERCVDKVRMRIGVPMAAYRRLVIAAHRPSGQASLRLEHEDPDLDVALGRGEADAVAHSARAWAALTGMAVVVEDASVVVRAPLSRRPREGRTPRRSRFARRRKTGRTGRLATVFHGEHEIIARD